MEEPARASTYEGNASSRKVRIEGWRLAQSDVPSDEIIADPAEFLETGASAWLRLGAALLMLVGLSVLFFATGSEFLGRLPPWFRVGAVIVSVAVLDAAMFQGYTAAAMRVAAETRLEGLKWMEGMEIGRLEWGKLDDVLLWTEEREGEPAESQSARGGRRLLLSDRLGTRLYFPETGSNFDRLLARLRMERPDVPTRVIASSGGGGEDPEE